MRKKIVHTLSILSLFCVFAQVSGPLFMEKEDVSIAYDVDNEADDEQEKKEKPLEDKEKEIKAIARYYALAGIKNLISAIPFKNEGKVLQPYLFIFSPPPDIT